MNNDLIYEVACYMRRLEEDHTVTIKFESLESVYGLVYCGRNGKYLMVINSNLSYEKQIETIWHEAKHIYSHAGSLDDIKIFEEDAITFSKIASKATPDIITACRNAW